ncbi:MAG: 2,3-bisphosphoglycerate-independent phosphoglycerate mutase [Candidatus Diapherotrites archaeon]
MNKKIIFIVCDGLGDRPVNSLGGKTPLEAAKTPNLDLLAEKGITGLIDVIDKSIYPDSDIAHLALFGLTPEQSKIERGPIEALGIGMDLGKEDVAFRCNFATVNEKMEIIDRRAGRIDGTEPLVKALNGIEVQGIKFLAAKGTGHRLILVMKGKGLSGNVSSNDPKAIGVKSPEVKALDASDEANLSAGALNEFLAKAREILSAHPFNKKREMKGLLPANYLLCRHGGKIALIPSMKQRFGVNSACIAGAGLYKGIGRLLGMRLIEVKGATGLPDSDLNAKIFTAIKALKEFDFVFVHIKAADSLGEDGNAEGKKKFIEKIDKAMAPLVSLKGSLVVVTADHCTPCELKKHSSDPVPVLVSCEGAEANGVKRFSEKDCSKGSLGRIRGIELMPLLMRLASKR